MDETHQNIGYMDRQKLVVFFKISDDEKYIFTGRSGTSND